jgi:hypothetical protein
MCATLIIAGLASVLWIGLLQQYLVLHRYRRLIAQDASHLLPTASAIDYARLVGRKTFIDNVLEDARITKRGESTIIIGESGSGKTAALLLLAHETSRRGLVPVVLSCRTVSFPDNIEGLAKARFCQAIDPYLWAESHGDRMWRRLQRAGRVMILLDGLDEATFSGGEQHWLRAVERTLRRSGRGLPVIATSRPEKVPDALPCNRVRLPSLRLEEAIGAIPLELRSRLSVNVEIAVTSLEANIVPLFLDILSRVLGDSGYVQLDPSHSVTDNRRILFHAWLDTHFSQHRESIGFIAIAFLEVGTYEESIQDIIHRASRLGQTSASEISAAIDLGLRHDIFRSRLRGQDTLIQVRHPMLLCYLTGLLGDRLRTSFKRVLDESKLPEAVESLAWSTLETQDPDGWMEFCGALSRPERSATAMLRIAQEAHNSLPAALANTLRTVEWGTHESERSALSALSKLTWDDVAVGGVLSYLDNEHYDLRWQACEAIAQRTDSNVLVVDWFSAAVSAAVNRTPDNPAAWGDGVTWVGPTVAAREALGGQSRKAMSALADQIVGSSRRALPGSAGGESCLAQGIKLSASVGVPYPATDLLEFLVHEAQFWFARFEAVAACGFYLQDSGDPNLMKLIEDAAFDAHPFVRACAHSAREVARGGNLKEWLWLNEREAVETQFESLRPEALQLLGDVTVFLTMSGQGTQASRDTRAYRNDLATCLVRKGGREHLIGQSQGCATDCSFGLCPYPTADAGRWSRGVLPEPFCRAVRHATLEVGPPPWFSGGMRSYLPFWRFLEGSTFRDHSAEILSARKDGVRVA